MSLRPLSEMECRSLSLGTNNTIRFEQLACQRSNASKKNKGVRTSEIEGNGYNGKKTSSKLHGNISMVTGVPRTSIGSALVG